MDNRRSVWFTGSHIIPEAEWRRVYDAAGLNRLLCPACQRDVKEKVERDGQIEALKREVGRLRDAVSSQGGEKPQRKPGGGKSSKYSPEVRAEKAKLAAELKADGLKWEQIEGRIGIPKSTLHDWHKNITSSRHPDK
jgi:hypothetical protein